jgi:hypothetical protein
MLGELGEAARDREDEDDEDVAEDAVDEELIGRLQQVPRLIVTTGYTATSRGGRCIIKAYGTKPYMPKAEY